MTKDVDGLGTATVKEGIPREEATAIVSALHAAGLATSMCRSDRRYVRREALVLFELLEWCRRCLLKDPPPSRVCVN